MKKNIFTVFAATFLCAIAIISPPLYADETMTAETRLQCDSNPVQPTTNDAPWKCPDLPNYPKNDGYSKTLADINYAAGTYVCSYFNNSGKEIIACNYKSKAYVDAMVKAKANIVGVDVMHFGKPVRGETLNYDADINTLGYKSFTPSEQREINAMVREINSLITKFKEFDDNKTTIGAELSAIGTSIEDIQNLSYEHLIKPYVSPSATDYIKKDNSFSMFLAGLITLDPDIIKGYDESSGKLIITDEWTTKAKAISTKEKNLFSSLYDSFSSTMNEIEVGLKNVAMTFYNALFGDGSTYTASADDDYSIEDSDRYALNVSSYTDIFEMKLWGFFYNLNRRLDIAYDIIVLNLIGVMLMWVALTQGHRIGTRYILNQEMFDEANKEAAISKVVSSILVVGTFFVSFSSPISSNNTVTNSDDIKSEMNRNNTIIKYLIRTSAQQGAKMATTVSDVALEPFLTFIMKKQHVYTGNDIKKSFASQILPIFYYAPATQVLHECKGYYNMSEQDIINTVSTINSSGKSILSPNSNFVKNNDFFTGNDVSDISFGLCSKSLKIVATMGKDIVYAMAETNERINNADAVMAKSVSYLVRNSILLEDRMGWVNIISVPMSYFMMKNYDMFLSQGLDVEAIEDKAKEYARAIALKDSDSISISDSAASSSENGFWGSLLDNFYNGARAVTRTAVDNTQDGLAYMSSWGSQFLMFGVLPGYNSIRKMLKDFMDKAYGDILEVRLYSREGEEKSATLLGKLASMIGGTKLAGKATSAVSWLGNGAGKILGKLGATGKAISAISGAVGSALLDVEDTLAWRTIIFFLSAGLAYLIWKMSFMMVFISVVSILTLVKIVLYFKDLFVHFFISPFMVVWAFASEKTNGGSKIVLYLRDTLILMMFPTIIVISLYTFIFVSELFNVLYIYIMQMALKGQEMNLSLMNYANSKTDGFTGYFTIYALGELSKMLIYSFSLYLAYIIIMQMPDSVLKKMGLGDSGASSITQSGEKFSQRMEKGDSLGL